MKKLGERQVIELLYKVLSMRSKNILLDDDVSTVKVSNLILALKCDMFVRSTDAPKQMKLWQMARKSIVSCVSDFACKGVKPLASLISIGMPRGFTQKDVKELAMGFKRAEREFHVNIIGGDTNESKDLVIDCCMLGHANNIVKRSGAKIDDIIIATGPFGYSSSGLKILLENARAKERFSKKAKKAVLMPMGRLQFGLKLAKYATSAMDSSDGLAVTLHELSRHSGKRFVIDNMPTTDEVREFATKNGYDVRDLAMHGGEEYEIIATIPSHSLGKVQMLAKNNDCKLFVIGKVQRGSDVFMKDGDKLVKIARRGWEHLT